VLLLSVWFSPARVLGASAPKGIDVVGVDAAGQEVKGQKWAVIIGVNKYERAASLRCSVADAKALNEVLTSAACGFPADNIRLLVDGAPGDSLPNRSNLIAALGSWLRLAGPEDLVLVYFTGHGKDNGTESFLLPCDVIEGDLLLTGVSISYVRQQLELCKAKRKILVLDMCHSGGKGDEAMTATTQNALQQGAGMVTLASCTVNEKSFEWEEKGRSVFSYYLTEALAGGADVDRDRNGYVSVGETYTHTVEGVRRWCGRTGNAQTPVKREDVTGEIFLGRVKPDAGPGPDIGGKVERADTFAHLRISSTPAGAAILVDNKPVGVTPRDLDLDLGEAEQKTFKAQVVAEGFRSEKVDVTGERGKVTPVELALRRLGNTGPVVGTRKRLGTLDVDTGEPGVAVQLDDQDRGVTGPEGKLTLSDVPVGRRSLRGAKAGFVPATQTVAVEEGKTVEVALGVKRLPGLKLLGDADAVGAGVEIDGLPAGALAAGAPLERGDLTVGKHTVRVTKDGYVPFEQELDGVAGVVAEIPVRLLKLPALEVTTEPDGCLVEVDGEDLGLSKPGEPVRKTRLSVGQHTVRVSRKGFVPFEQAVEGVAGETTPLQVRLQTSPILEVVAEADAQVELDGKLLGVIEGNQPLRLEELALGEHQVKVSLAGRVPFAQAVTAKPGDTLRVEAQLPNLPALTLTTRLAKVQVTLDGKEVGEVTEAEALELKNLSAGAHRLALKADGQPDWTESLDLRGGEVRDFELKPPDRATVEVTTDPPGAAIYVDGKSVGVTPAVVPVPGATGTPKEFTIELSKEGFETQYGFVSLRLGDAKRFDLALRRRPRVGEKRMNPTDGAEMVWIPAGTFKMGTENGEDDEKPVHDQTVSSFWMYAKEVTNGQYRKFLAANPQWRPERIGSELADGEYLQRWRTEAKGSPWIADDYPVVYVSWYAAKAYAEWAGGRLPTEAEWEYAARGGRQFEYGTATGRLTHDLANYDGKGGKDRWEHISPVGSFPPNLFGLYDLAGNVWEWCSSSFREYPYSMTDGREDPDESGDRVVRGGSWVNLGTGCRAASRDDHGFPSDCCNFFGFRCVVSAGVTAEPARPTPPVTQPPSHVIPRPSDYKFVPIPAGNGVAAFEIGKYEVTVAQFRRFVEATGYKTAAEKEGYSYGYTGTKWDKVEGLTWRNGSSLEEQAQDDHPVVHVSWEDAEAFCRWVGGRLPTHEEWEHAARGGLAEKKYVWGDDWPPPKGAGNFEDAAANRKYTEWTISDGYDDGFADTAPVGSFKPNGYGLYDVAGNVWEWVSEKPHCRGGSFYSSDPGDLAVPFRRACYGPSGPNLGFRVAMTP
jgi:formylglycine-generating enzyme required for sulfatase activity